MLVCVSAVKSHLFVRIDRPKCRALRCSLIAHVICIRADDRSIIPGHARQAERQFRAIFRATEEEDVEIVFDMAR